MPLVQTELMVISISSNVKYVIITVKLVLENLKNIVLVVTLDTSYTITNV
jgi:hypothetical protein